MARTAVPPELHDRWTFVPGASRRRLAPLLAELGSIDLFVHDSHHTRATMRVEFAAAWPALAPGGVLLADDVHGNDAFGTLAHAIAPTPLVIGQADGKSGLFGLAAKLRAHP